MTIDVRYMKWEEWAAQTGPSLRQFGLIGTKTSEADWRNWARQVVLAANLAGYLLPNPDHTHTWQEWARAFNKSVQSIGTIGGPLG